MAEQQPVKRRKGDRRALFLARIDAIRTELQQGWPVKTVYSRHASKLDMSYPQFWRYVSSLILARDPKESLHTPPVTPSPDPSAHALQVSKPDAGGPEIKQFTYNPRAKNPADLI